MKYAKSLVLEKSIESKKGKGHIALKEIRESNYWLKIISGISNENPDNELESFIQDSEELKKILGAICSKSGKSLK